MRNGASAAAKTNKLGLNDQGSEETLVPSREANGTNGALGHRCVELELELIQSHRAQKPVLRGEVGCACVAREISVERGNAPRDSGMCWKQFMICLEDTWLVVAFHSNPMHDPGLREVQRPARVCVCNLKLYRKY